MGILITFCQRFIPFQTKHFLFHPDSPLVVRHSLLVQGCQIRSPILPGQGDQVSGPGGAPDLGHSAVQEVILEVPPEGLAPLCAVVCGIVQSFVAVLSNATSVCYLEIRRKNRSQTHTYICFLVFFLLSYLESVFSSARTRLRRLLSGT